MTASNGTPARSSGTPTGPADSGEAPSGPPGAQVFTLEQRPAAGLYLVAWVLGIFGAGLALVGSFGQAMPLIVLGVLALGVGLAAGAGYQIVARRSRPSSAYRGPSPPLIFALVVVVVTIFGALIALLTGSRGLDVDRPEVFLVGLTIQVVAYVGLIAVFVVGPRALSWAQIANLRSGSRWQPTGDILFTTALMVPLTLIATVGGGVLALLLEVESESVLPVPETSADVLTLVLAAVVLAPIGEEVFFRGFALTAWLRDLGERSALIRSTVFFALVHVLNLQAAPGEFADVAKQALVMMTVALPVAAVLGWLFLRRGLLAAIAGHATYNGILLAFFVVGQQLLPAG